nr:reverse transcriptase domain-containing protein [Tanacetum cinerariifolium]
MSAARIHKIMCLGSVKIMSQKVTSSSIDSSWNARDTGRRKSNHPKSSKLVPLECAMVSGPEETPSAAKQIIEERVKVAINLEYLEQIVTIGSTLTEGGHNKLCGLLHRNLDIFAWKYADMTGVPRHIAEHRLNVSEGCSPVRQKKRGQATDRNQAIQEEVEKLIEAGIMREVHYHDWLSNPGMLIAELPVLTAPMEKEELIVYLAAAKETVSAVLMTEREAKQMPIYFVSRALRVDIIKTGSSRKAIEMEY